MRFLVRPSSLLLVLGMAAGCTPAKGGGQASSDPQGDSSAEPERRRPHVLLISLDTLRADRLGAYGYARPTSPWLDHLADESVLFTDAVAPSSKTATSHMSMFTGLHPGSHGVRNTYSEAGLAVSPDRTTLPERFHEAGYLTAGFTGGGMMSGELGFARGFDHYDDSGAGADRVFARAKAWMTQALAEAVDDETPLFLLLHTYEVHDPYTPPADVASRFVDPNYAGGIDATRVEYPEDASETWKTDPAFYASVQERFWGGFDGSEAADMQHISNLYDAGIAYTDQLLAEFAAWLYTTEIAEDLLIVVTSDHGEAFGEHGQLSHQSVHRQVLHVPLIVRLPSSDPRRAQRAGARVDRTVLGVDLTPSLIELAGLEPIPGVQGTSWVPALLGELDRWPLAWSEVGTPANESAALRWNSYKLIADRRRIDPPLFYDLEFDPAEKFDAVSKFEDIATHIGNLMMEQDKANLALFEAAPPVRVELGAGSLAAMMALGYVDGAEPLDTEPLDREPTDSGD